ncbi:hypothetical protein AB0L14_17275 [Streptomyces sp. NPDC052727]|uniref:hypothetical protein n=1 Tax=Streptomyces sp. NPDC052727 TaxID=3154854 RepID=UPI0034336471
MASRSMELGTGRMYRYYPRQVTVGRRRFRPPSDALAADEIPAAPGRHLRGGGHHTTRITVTVAVDQPVQQGDTLDDVSGVSAIVCGLVGGPSLKRVAASSDEPDLVVRRTTPGYRHRARPDAPSGSAWPPTAWQGGKPAHGPPAGIPRFSSNRWRVRPATVPG